MSRWQLMKTDGQTQLFALFVVEQCFYALCDFFEISDNFGFLTDTEKTSLTWTTLAFTTDSEKIFLTWTWRLWTWTSIRFTFWYTLNKLAKMEDSISRCVNCGIRLNRMWRNLVLQLDTRVISLIAERLAPHIVSINQHYSIYKWL